MARLRRTAGRALRLTAGKAEWQFIWRRLHAASLVGRNFGQADVDRSGELPALRYVRAKRPEAKVILDVGANVGHWSTQARRFWPSAAIHAFEPARETYERLVEARHEHRATCVQAACGAVSGTATLYAVRGFPGLSSLYERNLEAHELSMQPDEIATVTTVDEYCLEQEIDGIDYLKIDTEGHELAVLQGATRMIEQGRIAFIQFEFGGANLDSRTYLRDFVDLLTPRYRISRMLSNGFEPLAYRESEEVFVTTNFLAEQA